MSGDPAVAAEGQRGVVAWARDRRGRMPAREFFSGLGAADQTKVLAKFKRLAEFGQIHNREQFKKIEGTELFEFKSFQLRFLGAFRRDAFLVAHGLRRKRDKLDRSDMDIARRILSEHDETTRGGR